MDHTTITVEGKKLHIVADLDHPGSRSSSGKTTILASTQGNAKVTVLGIGEVSVGLNVFRK